MRRLKASLFTDTWQRFSEHGDMLAASTSFFVLLTIAPLFVVSIGVAGLIFDKSAARASLFQGLRRVASPEVTRAVRSLLEAAESQDSKVAAVIAVVVLIWGASRFFLQIQQSLNLIWGVRPVEQETFGATLRSVAVKRLMSIAMVLGCGGLLLLSLVLQAVMTALNSFTGGDAIQVPAVAAMVQQFVVSFALLTALFAAIYRVLPDARVHFRDVWIGAALTSLLTLGGTWLLGMFLSSVSPAWLQGALGSVAAFVIWTYYAAQVFFLGAAFTRAWSCQTEDHVEPETHAQLADPQSS